METKSQSFNIIIIITKEITSPKEIIFHQIWRIFYCSRKQNYIYINSEFLKMRFFPISFIIHLKADKSFIISVIS